MGHGFVRVSLVEAGPVIAKAAAWVKPEMALLHKARRFT